MSNEIDFSKRFATISDVKAFFPFVTECNRSDAELEALIARASELVNIMTYQRYDEDKTSHVEAVKLATCAQVERWIEDDVSPVSKNMVASSSVGGASSSFSAGEDTVSLCFGAIRYLLYAGLIKLGLSHRRDFHEV